MKPGNKIQVLIICVGIPIGMFLSNRSNQLHKQLEHPLEAIHKTMDHGFMDVRSDLVIPNIESLEVNRDAMSGYNISIITTNFSFTPKNVNTKHAPGEGHAHIYVNGEKYARIYAPHFHIPQLAAPIKEIRVTLNANGHETFSIGNKPVEKTWISEN